VAEHGEHPVGLPLYGELAPASFYSITNKNGFIRTHNLSLATHNALRTARRTISVVNP
jgi:hypothetical protein